MQNRFAVCLFPPRGCASISVQSANHLCLSRGGTFVTFCVARRVRGGCGANTSPPAPARTDSILEDEIDFIAAGQRGRVGDTLSYLIADDAHCVSECYWG